MAIAAIIVMCSSALQTAEANSFFNPAADHNAGDGPSSVAIGDLNGDGIPDLAVTDGWCDVALVLLGNGDGTFQNTQNYGVGFGPISFAIGDLDGDGNPELVIANWLSNNVSVLMNTPLICRADINHDKKVDEMDLEIFSFAMGEVDCAWWPALCDCDTDDDDDIGGSDLKVLISEFGRDNCK